MWIVKNKGLYFTSVTETRNSARKLKQQRRRRLLKPHLKSEFAMPQTFNIALIPARLIRQIRRILKDCIKVQEKRKKVVLRSRP